MKLPPYLPPLCFSPWETAPQNRLMTANRFCPCSQPRGPAGVHCGTEPVQKVKIYGDRKTEPTHCGWIPREGTPRPGKDSKSLNQEGRAEGSSGERGPEGAYGNTSFIRLSRLSPRANRAPAASSGRQRDPSWSLTLSGGLLPGHQSSALLADAST